MPEQAFWPNPNAFIHSCGTEPDIENGCFNRANRSLLRPHRPAGITPQYGLR